MTLRRVLQFGVPLAAFIALAALIANGPLYRGKSLQQCLAAYTNARTRGDTARVDLHPYRDERDSRSKHRCGAVRAASATDSLPLLSGRTP